MGTDMAKHPSRLPEKVITAKLARTVLWAVVDVVTARIVETDSSRQLARGRARRLNQSANHPGRYVVRRLDVKVKGVRA